MPTPAECQPIADTIASLTAQEQAQTTAILSLAGLDKWKAMEALGALRQKISDQNDLLAKCMKEHAADFSVDVVIFDLPGTSGTNRIGRIWQLTSTGQAVKQTSSLQSGTVKFSGILAPGNQLLGITIEETDHPTVNGPDFRSAPLKAVEDAERIASSERIEIVILDPILVTADSLTQSAPPLPVKLSLSTGPVGTIDISVNSLQIAISNGDVSLVANGTATAAGTTSTFTFSNVFHFMPTFTMAPSQLIEPLAGIPPTFSVSGLIGSVIAGIGPLLSSNLADLAIKPIASLLNDLISRQVIKSLGLETLPSGSVLSVRELTATGDGIRIVPALGAFGTVLSDFQPSQSYMTPQLIALKVQPTTLITDDHNDVAQGTITLDRPAPSSGVIVQLSCDRIDLLRIDPTSINVPAGANSGQFTATAIAQSIMGTATLDGVISASVGTKTLTTTISIKAAEPATTTPHSTSIFPLSPSLLQNATKNFVATPKSTAVITNISFENNIVSHGAHIQGMVLLDGYYPELELIDIAFAPHAAAPAMTVIACNRDQSGASYGVFGFTFNSNFVGGYVTVEAKVKSSGSYKDTLLLVR